MTNWNDDFKARVDFAADHIARGTPSNRRFDSCFENNDGDAVVTALYRRAKANPDGKLAQNIWRYLCKESVSGTAIDNGDKTDLEAWSRHLRRPFCTEFTPAGEQTVIPGCERDDARTGAKQMSLF